MKWEADYVMQAAGENRIVAGFNVFGYEDASAVIRAAEKVGAPVLLMINRGAREVLPVETWATMLRSLGDSAEVPVGVHLDHCSEPDLIRRAICCGFTSVMYDGSHSPLSENIRTTRELANLAHQEGVFLEAELGTVPYSDLGETHITLTDPEEACLMQQNGCPDWLAVSVGNIHRLTSGTAVIQFPVLQIIEQNCTLPLVIHGSSGIQPEDLHRLKTTRVGKMNFGTVLRQAFGDTLRQEFQKAPREFDRLKLFAAPAQAVERAAERVLCEVWNPNPLPTK